MNVLKLVPNKKAPGVTLIPYELLKHLDPLLLNEIIKLFNSVIQKSFMLDDWLISNIILLPKPKDWKGNLDLIQSIALLETI